VIWGDGGGWGACGRAWGALGGAGEGSCRVWFRRGAWFGSALTGRPRREATPKTHQNCW